MIRAQRFISGKLPPNADRVPIRIFDPRVAARLRDRHFRGANNGRHISQLFSATGIEEIAVGIVIFAIRLRKTDVIAVIASVTRVGVVLGAGITRLEVRPLIGAVFLLLIHHERSEIDELDVIQMPAVVRKPLLNDRRIPFDNDAVIERDFKLILQAFRRNKLNAAIALILDYTVTQAIPIAVGVGGHRDRSDQLPGTVVLFPVQLKRLCRYLSGQVQTGIAVDVLGLDSNCKSIRGHNSRGKFTGSKAGVVRRCCADQTAAIKAVVPDLEAVALSFVRQIIAGYGCCDLRIIIGYAAVLQIIHVAPARAAAFIKAFCKGGQLTLVVPGLHAGIKRGGRITSTINVILVISFDPIIGIVLDIAGNLGI